MMISQASQSHDRFATTRWSMVMQPDAADSSEARDALGDLAQRYWYPVYSYVRRSGHAPELAETITHALLRRLVAESAAMQQPIASRQYRHYLLDRVRAFLDDDWHASMAPPAAELAPPLDLEKRFQRDHTSPSSPEQAFQRSFALAVLQRTVRRLREEARQAGRSDLCRALEPYLARDPAACDYARIAAQLRTHKVTLILALKRLRQRLRELCAQELADTVSSADDLAAEQNAMLAVLDEM